MVAVGPGECQRGPLRETSGRSAKRQGRVRSPALSRATGYEPPKTTRPRRGSGAGHAPRCGVPSGKRVDGDRREENETSGDVLNLDGKPEREEAVVDGADRQAAQEAVDRPTAPTEQARATDDCSGDGEQHVLAAVVVGGDAT